MYTIINMQNSMVFYVTIIDTMKIVSYVYSIEYSCIVCCVYRLLRIYSGLQNRTNCHFIKLSRSIKVRKLHLSVIIWFADLIDLRKSDNLSLRNKWTIKLTDVLNYRYAKHNRVIVGFYVTIISCIEDFIHKFNDTRKLSNSHIFNNFWSNEII